MTENATTKVLKSLKATAGTHREIKMESARTGLKIEDLVERAWIAYKATTPLSIANVYNPLITKDNPDPSKVVTTSLKPPIAINSGNSEASLHEGKGLTDEEKDHIRQAEELGRRHLQGEGNSQQPGNQERQARRKGKK